MKEENRIRKNTDNYPEYWWLRSAGIYGDYYGDYYVAYVSGYSNVSSDGYYDGHGVVPSFII